MNQWTITAGGDSVVIEGNPVDFILARPGLFGLTPDDVAFVRRKIAVNDYDIWETLITRVLYVGIAVECPMDIVGPDGSEVRVPTSDGAPRPIRRRGWRHVGTMSPPSPLEPGQNLKDEDDPVMLLELDSAGELVVAFHRESHSMWGRLIKWIERAPVETNITAKTVVLLKEWDTQRAWAQTVQGIFQDYQFSKDPARGARCNRCGAQISWDEMVAGAMHSEAATCPKCGLPLA